MDLKPSSPQGLRPVLEDEGEPESDDVEHPEPESEDPSGPVNQINQMTMGVWEASDCGSLKLEY